MIQLYRSPSMVGPSVQHRGIDDGDCAPAVQCESHKMMGAAGVFHPTVRDFIMAILQLSVGCQASSSVAAAAVRLGLLIDSHSLTTHHHFMKESSLTTLYHSTTTVVLLYVPSSSFLTHATKSLVQKASNNPLLL